MAAGQLICMKSYNLRVQCQPFFFGNGDAIPLIPNQIHSDPRHSIRTQSFDWALVTKAVEKFSDILHYQLLAY
jgi:hypothetical protein